MISVHDERLRVARADYEARKRTWIGLAQGVFAGHESVITPETVEHWRAVEAAGRALTRERDALEAYASKVAGLEEDHGS